MMKNTISVAALLMTVCATHAAGTDKTLVSWVALTDKDLRSGSILTIQKGSEFDGIVFAEKAPDKWMAGSDMFRRTQERQDGSPIEASDGEPLLQMAIVYRGDTIAIFRNGEPYASYKAKNIDLLGGNDNFAVFGMRHVGGNGSIGGSIEDARIYGRALSVRELKSLDPDRRSSIEPYAWWDFENGKPEDRTGRFPDVQMRGGARISDGRLVLGPDASLVARRPYVPDHPSWPDKPPADWLTYHLAHPGPGNAFPGDPNPAFYWKGRYHLHYIYRNRTGFVFAHVSSKDMVRWKWHKTVLGPRTTGHGMFSGTGFITRDGRAAMVYHGQGSGRNWISYAVDDGMNKWSDPKVMLPTDSDGKPLTSMPYFDPDIWVNDGTYYGLNGRSSRDSAVIMKSENLNDWTHIGELLHPDFDEQKLGVSKAEDISCANMFKLGNKWVLTCISHRLGCRYFIGDFKGEQYLPEFHAMMSWQGNNFFAPESLLTPDGRRVMWAWIMKGANPTGVQSLPRELELPEDGVLRIKPLRELQSLRCDGKVEKMLTVVPGRETRLEWLTGDAIELEITFAAPLPKEFGVKLLGDDKGENAMSIVAGAGMKRLMVGKLDPEFSLKNGEDLTLRMFIDKNLVEVFANDRQAAACPHGHVRENPNIRLFTSGSNLVVKEVKGWKMKSIYQPAD